MKIARTAQELTAALSPAWRANRKIGLVPTMGALHEGHLSLLRAAREECEVVVISVFVNPSQFTAGEDFETYPRDEERDLRMARGEGVDVAFVPDAGEMYPAGFASSVQVQGLSEVLCGSPDRRGPGHFHAVTTVVCKLLNLVRPARAYFGSKDGQQVAVIARMVRDLAIPVEVVAMPTVRESDGLAMSSRNVYLSEAERALAAAIPRALGAGAAAALSTGEASDAVETARRELLAAGIEPEYLEVRDRDDLEPVIHLNGRPAMLAVAARIGSARLIDNTVIEPGKSPEEALPA